MLLSQRSFPPLLFLLLALSVTACGRGADSSGAPAPPAPSVSAAASADRDAAPDPVEPEINQAQYVDNLSLIGMRLGDYYFMFHRGTLSEALTTIGAGVRGERGDGSGYEGWLCYTMPRQGRMWLISNQAGGGEYITGMRALADAALAADAKCPNLPARYARLTLDPDVVQLGAPITQLEHRFGTAPAFGDWRVYARETSFRRDSLDFTESSMVAVRVADGRIVALDISKTLTN